MVDFSSCRLTQLWLLHRSSAMRSRKDIPSFSGSTRALFVRNSSAIGLKLTPQWKLWTWAKSINYNTHFHLRSCLLLCSTFLTNLTNKSLPRRENPIWVVLFYSKLVFLNQIRSNYYKFPSQFVEHYIELLKFINMKGINFFILE